MLEYIFIREQSASKICESNLCQVDDEIMGACRVISQSDANVVYRCNLSKRFCECDDSSMLLCKHLRAAARKCGGLERFNLCIDSTRSEFIFDDDESHDVNAVAASSGDDQPVAETVATASDNELDTDGEKESQTDDEKVAESGEAGGIGTATQCPVATITADIKYLLEKARFIPRTEANKANFKLLNIELHEYLDYGDGTKQKRTKAHSFTSSKKRKTPAANDKDTSTPETNVSHQSVEQSQWLANAKRGRPKKTTHGGLDIPRRAADAATIATIQKDMEHETPLPTYLLECLMDQAVEIGGVTAMLVGQLEEATREQRKSKIWLAVRRERITASIAHRVAFAKDAETQLNLKKEIMEGRNTNVTTAIRYGIEKEPTAFRKYGDGLPRGSILRQSGFWISLEQYWMGATPDGVVVSNRGKCLGIVEIKCPFTLKNGDRTSVKSPSFLDVNWNLKESHQYYTQVQMQLHATKAPWCDFVVYLGCTDEIKVERIFPNPQKLKEILQRLTAFFDTHIKPEYV